MLRSLLIDVLVTHVLSRIEPLFCLLVYPVVPNDTVFVRMRTREQGRVPDSSVCCRMAVVIIPEPRSAIEPQSESAGTVLVVILHQLVLWKAIDDHEEHELWDRFATRPAAPLRASSSSDK